MAVAEVGRSAAREIGTFASDWHTVEKQLKKLACGGYRLEVCYEAGPTGHGLHRWLLAAGYHSEVVAPSLIPVKAGQRVKTDRRDAAKRDEKKVTATKIDKIV